MGSGLRTCFIVIFSFSRVSFHEKQVLTIPTSWPYQLTTRLSLQNEAAARLWINAFFYRVASMTPNGKKMVLSVEQGIPSVSLSDHSADTMNGHIDWTAIATSPLKAGASPSSDI